MNQVSFEPSIFRRDYNRRPFLVQHQLHRHPLMQLSSLRELALRLERKQVIFRVGSVPVNADFDRAHLTHPIAGTLEDALDNITTAGVAITINTPETDPVYRVLIEEILAEIRALSDPMDPGMNWTAAYIFISAPGSLTPYHMDREMNFLFQIQGSKSVSLWDGNDTSIMSDEDVERLFGEYVRPKYKEAAASAAQQFELGPGLGVHHPFIAPHLVRTCNEVSVSLAVTYRTRQTDRLADLHKVNYRLRRMGLHPTRAGVSPMRDSLKSSVLTPALRGARRLRGQRD
ncbi:MAG: transcription factor jumonji JmjC domain-containing protein [Acidobacteriota bacterium]